MMVNSARQAGPITDSRFVRFLLAGGFAAAINFGSRFFYSLFVDFSTAVVLAFFTGLTTAFVLNKTLVFTSSRNTVLQEAGWFALINLLALAQTWALSVYLAMYLAGVLPVEGDAGRELAQAISHGAGILLPVVTSYIGHKYLTFRQ